MQRTDLRLRIDDACLAPLDDSQPPSPLSLDPPRLLSPGTSSLAHRSPLATSSMPALSPSSSTSKPSFFRRIFQAFSPSNKRSPLTPSPISSRSIPPKSPLSPTPILSASRKLPRTKSNHVSISAPNANPIPIDQIHFAPPRAQRESNAARVNKWLESTPPTTEAFDTHVPSIFVFDTGEADVAAVCADDEEDHHNLRLILPIKELDSIGEDDAPLSPAVVLASPFSSDDSPSNGTHPSPVPKFLFSQEIEVPMVVLAEGEGPPPPASPTIPAPLKAARRASALTLLTGGSKASSSNPASPLSPASPNKPERKGDIPRSKSSPLGKHQSFAGFAGPKRSSLFNLAHIGGGRPPSMPSLPKKEGSGQSNASQRQSVMPTMHTTASISAQMHAITDDESKRLTEAAFMF